MSNNSVKVGLIQMVCSIKADDNISKAISSVESLAKKGANIICLQELFSTIYFCNETDERYFEYAEAIPGPVTEKFSKIAKEHKVVLILPYFERLAAGIYYNTAAVIDADGRYLGKYRKTHIPDDPGFYEKYYFTPGDTGYKVFNTRYGNVGILICWDQWYPEAARLTALKGADIIFYPTAIGTLPVEGQDEKNKFMDAWLTIQRSHAIANGCFVASINRVGEESNISFWGNSFVSGPFGELLARAGEQEEVLLVECNFDSIEKQRRIWPFFRDRRIDTYDDITKRYLDDI
jgi:N-carbamoylputrescine amidase